MLKQLPQKTEHIEKVPMSEEQSELYEDLKKKFSEEVAAKEDKDDGVKSKGGATMLMELRKAANHHLLVRRKYNDQKLRKMAKAMLKVRYRRNQLSS